MGHGLHERARRCLERLVQRVAATPPEDIVAASHQALFWHELVDFVPEEATLGYQRAWEVVADTLHETTSRALVGGLAGVGWIAQFCLDGAEREILCGRIDRALTPALRDPRDHFDLASGLAGLGIYLLERDHELARQAAVALVERARLTPYGRAWLTGPELLLPWQERLAAGGWYDLGLPHGSPGVIATLSRVVRSTNDHGLIGPLSEASSFVESFVAQESGCPKRIAPQLRESPGRGWCYGDLSVAFALFCAGRCLSNSRMESLALSLARRHHAQFKDDEMSSIVCHGTAGVALLTSCLGNAADEPTLRAQSAYWLERTLKQLECGREVGARTILDGLLGIGLAIATCAGFISSEWCELILPGCTGLVRTG